MAVKKNKPQMTPIRTNKGASTGRLMDNQDTTTRGDGKESPKTPTTVLLPSDLKQEAQEVASKNEYYTMTRLIVEGLRMRLDAGDLKK